jgi:hypothetical protein
LFTQGQTNQSFTVYSHLGHRLVIVIRRWVHLALFEKEDMTEDTEANIPEEDRGEGIMGVPEHDCTDNDD